MRIFVIKAIFDPKNPFLTNSIDDRIKIKAEITSFNMRYYMYIIKVAVALASCDHQKCKLRVVAGAELRVRQLKIGRKSCFGNFLWIVSTVDKVVFYLPRSIAIMCKSHVSHSKLIKHS